MNNLTRDLGQAFIACIAEKMMIDEEWSLRAPCRVTWWPHRLRQTIWVDPPFIDEGMTVWRAHCQTDLIRGFGGTREERELITSHAMCQTLSGFARNPDDPPRVQTAASVFFHEETFDWAWRTIVMDRGLTGGRSAP